MRYQFKNYLSIIETNLDTDIFLVSKIVSNLANITTIFFFKIGFYLMIF